MSKKNEVIVQDEKTALISAQVSAGILDDIGMEDYALPFLLIASAQSDIVTPNSDKYNENARPGMVYDSVTNQAFKFVSIIPCTAKKAFVEWTPETKGTFVAEHTADSPMVLSAETVTEEKNGKQITKKVTPTGNTLVETITYGVVYITPDGEVGQALLPFSKTRLAIARNFNTMIKQNQSKGHGICSYKLSTVVKTKDGNSWYVHKIENEGPVTDPSVIEAASTLASMKDNLKPADTAEVSDTNEVV